MIKIIKTDISISVRMLVLVVIYVAVFPMLFKNVAYMSTIGSLAVYVYVLNLFASEERDRVNMMYKIMPVRAEDIVGAKYAECVMIWIIATVINIVVVYAMDASSMLTGYVNPADSILSSFVTMGLIAGVTLPFVYKYGYAKSRIPVMFAWLVISFATPAVEQVFAYLSDEKLFPVTAVLGAAAAVIVIVMLVSARISVRIYKNV